VIRESCSVDEVEVSGCLEADVLSGVETENQWGSGRQNKNLFNLTVQDSII